MPLGIGVGILVVFPRILAKLENTGSVAKAKVSRLSSMGC